MQRLSIKQKITFSLITFVSLTAIVIGYLSQWTAKNIIESRMLSVEMPNIMKQINANIDKEILTMSSIAQQLATDSFILQWSAEGQNGIGEQLLIKKLKSITRLNNLSSTSFADKNSAKYWNQDGFLRVL